MKRLFFLLFVFIVSLNQINGQGLCKPVQLQIEHLENPLGIDNPMPRFSWKLGDERSGAIQKAYQIIVGTDSMDVVKIKGDIWDTKRQSSDAILVTYNGQKLEPFTRYYWKVIV